MCVNFDFHKLEPRMFQFCNAVVLVFLLHALALGNEFLAGGNPHGPDWSQNQISARTAKHDHPAVPQIFYTKIVYMFFPSLINGHQSGRFFVFYWRDTVRVLSAIVWMRQRLHLVAIGKTDSMFPNRMLVEFWSCLNEFSVAYFFMFASAVSGPLVMVYGARISSNWRFLKLGKVQSHQLDTRPSLPHRSAASQKAK